MNCTAPSFLLVDDHALFRVGLALMLTERWPQALLTQAGTWAQALSHLQAQAVDVVLLDIHLPDGNGLSGLPALHALAPQAHVLLMSVDGVSMPKARLGTSKHVGFVSKSAQAADILAAVQGVMRGDHPGVDTSTAVAPDHEHAAPGGPAFSELQANILRHLGKGTPNKAIARQLGMSESDVRAEVSWITEWLQATSRREAYERAVATGVIAP